MVLKSGNTLLRGLYLRSQNPLAYRFFSVSGKKPDINSQQSTQKKQDFNPFSVRLEADAKKSPSAITRIRDFFSKVSGTGAEEAKEGAGKTPDQIYQQIKKEKDDSQVGPDGKALTPQTDLDKRTKIMEMIEKNINRKYFSEKRLSDFFAECFSLKNPAAFAEEN